MSENDRILEIPVLSHFFIYFGFYTKNFVFFSQKFMFLTNIFIFGHTFDFFTKIFIFDHNFDFWPEFRSLAILSIFDQNVDFCRYFCFLPQNSCTNFYRKIGFNSNTDPPRRKFFDKISTSIRNVLWSKRSKWYWKL